MNEILLYTLELRSESSIVTARQRAKLMAAHLGFGTQDQTRLTTTVSEMMRNAYKYAVRGHIDFFVHERKFLVRVSDPGAGIADLPAILDSEVPASTGLGLDIVGVQNLMDIFQIETTPEAGTTVLFGKYLPPDTVIEKAIKNILDDLEQQNFPTSYQEVWESNQALKQNATEQEKLLNTLRETEQRLRAVINSAKDYAIFTMTAQGLIDSWSIGAEDTFGYFAAEVMGQPVTILFTAEDQAQVIPEQEMQTAITFGYANDDRWLVRKDGSRFFANGSLRPLYDNHQQVIGFTKVARDMTERKRMEEFERQQHYLMRFLRDMAVAMSRSLELPQILDYFLESVHHLIPMDGVNIMLLEDNNLQVVRSYGYKSELLQLHYHWLATASLTIDSCPAQQQILATRHPLLLADIQQYPGYEQQQDHYPAMAYMGLPLIIDDEVIGFLNINSATLGFFTQAHLKPLEAFLAQAVIAMKNARLHQQVQRLAILEERQRLSRDLHDSISQMVFSSSLFAEALPSIIHKHPEKVEQHVDSIRRLNRGAHAELRKMLVELRLEGSVNEIDLIESLHQLSQAAMGHTEINVSLDIQGDMNLPQVVQIAFYRIAQEALNNIIKHARASQVELVLSMTVEASHLAIKDNGRGFNLNKSIGTEHIGLQNMRERAAGIDALLETKSEPGQGTEVIVTWTA